MLTHERKKKIFQISGICLVALGGILSIIGFVDFFASFSSFDMPKLFWCSFLI